ncbi:Formate/nitrite transporter [Dichomitus squalens]|uniref:Formate/nitrite transporter n=2 Tax=Dichomitus squalens TaxID=114155 RepID=A0A4Q9NCR0_9APHY|nr:Formate/nitrite transporter [Dichomitus squalens LYAD-421 SS1]EJF57741.1 Formate/nitrite transporter [Dichomitus squalens LYAD-421 SS1]TBU38228.1 Formate/nitrite transporter [Dichomitus squalens]TBU64261.1 Formate/nitrite transporter [Dichomitus squalens]
MASLDPPSTLKPAQVAVAMIESGIAKHRTRADLVFFKAVAAGVMLSFGGLLSEIVSGGAAGVNESNPGLVKFFGGAVFPVGLIMIVLQGQELLTSNMMIYPMACIKGAVPWWGLPYNWLIVTFGNLCGSLFFAAVLVKYTGIISTAPYNAYAVTFALHKAAEPQWHQIFLRGIACNWLVCVAVWQAAGARDTISKIVAIWVPIMIFVTCGYDHVVANMFSVPLGILFGAPLTAAEYIRKSLIAAYLGNIIGALLVALPALYFYAPDYRAGGLRDAEAGEVINQDRDDRRDSPSTAVYEVDKRLQ